MAAQTYPTYNRRAAKALLAKGCLPGYVRRRLDAHVELDIPGDAPQKYPGYNPERTPTADERLTSEGGAELGARTAAPGYSRQGHPAVVGKQSAETTEAAHQPSRYELALQKYADLRSAPVEDTNGRLRSGAKFALLGPRQPTDSLGNAAGQALANFVVGAFVDKRADEKFDRQRELERQGHVVAVEGAAEKAARESEQATAALRKTNAEAANEEARPAYNAAQVEAAREEAERSNLRQTWNGLQEFDPTSNDPTVKAIVAAADRLHTFLPKKTRHMAGWQLQKIGDRTVLFNPDTKEVQEATLNGQPPNPIESKGLTAKDLMPEVSAVLGLKGDEEIKDLARSRVSKLNQRTRTVDVNPALLREGSPYRNQDGSPNEAAIWKAIDDTALNLRDAFPAVTDSEADDYEREAAAARHRLRAGESERRAAAERFAGIIERVSRNPDPQGSPYSVNDLMTSLKGVLALANAKERSRELEKFFRELEHVRLTR